MRTNQTAAESVSERALNALHALSTGRGDIRARLKVVGQILLPIQVAEWPAALQPDIQWIMEQLTKHPAQHQEGNIEATMRRIQNRTGEKIANRFFGVYSRLQELRGRPLR